MRAFCALVAIAPVLQCLAEECSDTVHSCTAKQASLMQLKSSSLKKQALALDTEESVSSKLAGFQKFTDEMVAKYGASASEAPSKSVLGAVATVLQFIDDMNGHLLKFHQDDVGTANGCSVSVQHCFDSFMSATIIEEIKAYKATSEAKEVTHQTCRQGAQADCQSLCEVNGACDKYDNYRKNDVNRDPNPASLPQCVSDGHLADEYIRADEADGSKLEQMEECLEKMKVWLDGSGQDNDIHEGLYTRYEECDRVSNGCEADVAACDSQQGEFQQARCLYAMESNLRCDAFQTCYGDARDACVVDCDQIIIRAAARAADIETGQRLVCLLHTLFGERDPDNTTDYNKAPYNEETWTGFFPRPSDEQRPGLLAACSAKEFTEAEAANWAIQCPAGDAGGSYPVATPTIVGYVCPVSHVTEPCTDDFQNDMSSMWPNVVSGFPYSTPICSQIAQRGVQKTSLPCGDAGNGACIVDPDHWSQQVDPE